MVEVVFSTIVAINRAGTAVLMVEQNAKQALAISHCGFVLELGKNRFEGKGRALLDNPGVHAGANKPQATYPLASSDHEG